MVLMEINEKISKQQEIQVGTGNFLEINGNRKLWNMGGFPKI